MPIPELCLAHICEGAWKKNLVVKEERNVCILSYSTLAWGQGTTDWQTF